MKIANGILSVNVKSKSHERHEKTRLQIARVPCFFKGINFSNRCFDLQ